MNLFGYEADLTRKGYQQIGSGSYGNVFHKPGEDYVIKIAHRPDEDGWPTFAAWAMANQSPHLPKIWDLEYHDEENFPFVTAKIEKLDRLFDAEGETREKSYSDFYSFRQIARDDFFPNFIRKHKPDPSLTELAQTIRNKFADEWMLDLHDGNFMLRPNGTPTPTLVVTDPISYRRSRMFE